MQTPDYEESHEAVNRDSCKMIAEYFNNECGKRANKGHFVFFSAAQSLVPMLSRYIEMKR